MATTINFILSRPNVSGCKSGSSEAVDTKGISGNVSGYLNPEPSNISFNPQTFQIQQFQKI
ncbi:MAG: hypothetical protein R3A12_12335 [Ignavibacteria bacterium]